MEILMAMLPQEYKGWRIRISRRIDDEGYVQRYTIHSDSKLNDWYDEIRYDSFEIRGGKLVDAPHLHIKIRSTSKTLEAGIAEIQEIIDRYLPALKKVSER
jgi:hypothetical protein